MFSQPTLGTRTSPYLQEKLALLGTNQIFAEVPKLVDSLLGIKVSQSQVYRVVQAVSQEMEDPCLPSTPLKNIHDQPDEQVYGMIDAGPPVRVFFIHR